MHTLDLTRVTTYPIAQRRNLVHLADLRSPDAPAPDFDSEELEHVAEAIVTARRGSRPVLWMIGAHVVKSGLSRLVIDLMQRGIVTHVAGNGAVSIHDFELALIGETSEDVATSIEDGSFGMADETGRLMNQAIRAGVRDGLGYGAVARPPLRYRPGRFPHRDVEHPLQRLPARHPGHDPRDHRHRHHPPAPARGLRRPSARPAGSTFRPICRYRREAGGRRLLQLRLRRHRPRGLPQGPDHRPQPGPHRRRITTANFDLLPLRGDYHADVGKDDIEYYYRPRKNIVNRPTSLGGEGYHITGDHVVTIPSLHHRVTAALEQVPLHPEPPAVVSLSTAAGGILARSHRAAPRARGGRDRPGSRLRELVHCFRTGGTLYLCGNGGGMADALHISGELLKSYAHPRPLPEGLLRGLASQPDGGLLARNLEGGLRAVVLGANPALSSAVANDRPDRDVALAQELLALAHPGDVLLGISTSGNARNVAYAARSRVPSA